MRSVRDLRAGSLCTYWLTPTIDALALLELALELVRSRGDLALRVALLDRRDHAAHLVDALDVLERLGLELVREPLDEVAAAERIDGVRDAALVRDDLLRAERDA